MLKIIQYYVIYLSINVLFYKLQLKPAKTKLVSTNPFNQF